MPTSHIMGCGLGTFRDNAAAGPACALQPPLLVSKSLSYTADFASETQALDSLAALQKQLDGLNSQIRAIDSELQTVVTTAEQTLQSVESVVSATALKEQLAVGLKRLGDCQVAVTQAYIQARTTAQQLQMRYLLVHGAAAGLDKLLRASKNCAGVDISDTVKAVEDCGSVLNRLYIVEPSETLVFALKQAKRTLGSQLALAFSLQRLAKSRPVSEGEDGFTDQHEEQHFSPPAVQEDLIIEEFSAEMQAIEEVLVAAEAPDMDYAAETLSSRTYETGAASPYRYEPFLPLEKATFRPEFALLECLEGPLACRYGKLMEIQGVYSELQEGNCQFGPLNQFYEENKDTKASIMDEKQLFTVLSETFLRKAVDDRRKISEKQSPDSPNSYIFSTFQANPIQLLSILQSLRFFSGQNHPTAQLFCRILDFSLENCYPPAVAQTIAQFLTYFPASAYPLGLGNVSLAEILFLFEQLFEKIPEMGMAFLRFLRPDVVNTEKFVHFLLFFKVKYRNSRRIFTEIAGEQDKVPVKALASGLKRLLGLLLSDSELIAGLQALNPTSNGLITRVAFQQAVNQRRFANLSKRPEFQVETTILVEKFAAFCLQMRRRAVEMLASVYIRRGKSRFSEAFTGLADCQDFQTAVKTAEKQLLGPFATVHFSKFHIVRLCEVSSRN